MRNDNGLGDSRDSLLLSYKEREGEGSLHIEMGMCKNVYWGTVKTGGGYTFCDVIPLLENTPSTPLF